MPTPEWRAKHGREKLSDEARERRNAKSRTDEGRAYKREAKRRERARKKAEARG